MREITRQVVNAFREGRKVSKGNTMTDYGVVRLHGNLIARRDTDGTFYVTLAGWNTPTTRERVNGVINSVKPHPNEGFCQFNSKPMICGIDSKRTRRPADANGWYKIQTDGTLLPV